MARIEWMLLCETALLDRQGRVSLIGVATDFPVPSVPIVIKQLMMVARVVEARTGDEMREGRGSRSARRAAGGRNRATTDSRWSRLVSIYFRSRSAMFHSSKPVCTSSRSRSGNRKLLSTFR